MKRKIKMVEQTEHSECGLACATMILNYEGINISLNEIRDTFGVPRGGISLYHLIQVMTASVTVQTLVLVVNRLYTQPLNLAWGIIVLSSVLIWNMAPVQSINRELDADEKKHCRKVAVKIIVGIYVFAGICTLTGMKAIVSLVAVTMAVVLISQYIGAVKYKIEKR